MYSQPVYPHFFSCASIIHQLQQLFTLPDVYSPGAFIQGNQIPSQPKLNEPSSFSLLWLDFLKILSCLVGFSKAARHPTASEIKECLVPRYFRKSHSAHTYLKIYPLVVLVSSAGINWCSHTHFNKAVTMYISIELASQLAPYTSIYLPIYLATCH